MKYSEIKLYDVGRSGNRGFPEQQKMKVVKPLLKDVFKAVNDYAKKNKLKPVRFNIEIKSKPEWDNSFTPVPAVFAKMVYEEIVKHKLEKQVIVQSFDVRPLQELRRLPAKLPIALLVMNKDGVEKNIAGLVSTPTHTVRIFRSSTKRPSNTAAREALKSCRGRSTKSAIWKE
jgi:glycerophosphoryl diester phosphodiesterase